MTALPIHTLEANLNAANTPRDRVDALNALAEALLHSDVARAGQLGQEAQNLAISGPFQDDPYRVGLAHSLQNRSLALLYQGKYEEALPNAFEALRLFREIDDLTRQADVLHNIGEMNYDLGNYPQAMEYELEVLRITEQTGDRKREAGAINVIGLVFGALGEYDNALAYFEVSLGLYQDLGFITGQAETLDNICNMYCYQQDYDTALSYGQASLALYQELNDRKGEAAVLKSIGEVYQASGDYRKALHYYQRCTEVAVEIGYKLLHIWGLLGRGRVYLLVQKPGRALTCLSEALSLAEATGSRRLLYENHQSLAAAYEQAGNEVQALAHYKQFHQVKEEVFNSQADSRLKNLQIIYEVETTRREAEIARLRNVELQHKIEAREVLIAELDSFAHTVAHDLKGPLSLIAGFSEILCEDLTPDADSETAQMLDELVRISHKSIRIIHELLLLAGVRHQKIAVHPLDMDVIIREVESRLQHLHETGDVTILHPETWPQALGYAPWVEEVWFNYLSNGIKYGGEPTRLLLGATPLPDGQVCFWVKDNGQGLSQEAQARLFTDFERLDNTRAQGHGLGLSIVKRIVEKLGGEVGVQSTGVPGEGCTFSFTLPALKRS